MAEESAEFEKWLRQADADMRESVESAIDVEADLVAFKQKAFAQVVAVAHAEGNDAPDKAVRSVLAGVDVVDDCRTIWAPISMRSCEPPESLVYVQFKSAAPQGSGFGLRLPGDHVAKSDPVRGRRRDAALLAGAAVVGMGAVATSIWGSASVATGLLAVTSAAVTGIAAVVSVRLGRAERQGISRSDHKSPWLKRPTKLVAKLATEHDDARRAYVFNSFLLSTLSMGGMVRDDCLEAWARLTAKDCSEIEAPPSEDRQGEDRPSEEDPLHCVSGHDPGAVSVRASHRRRRSRARRSSRTRPPNVNDHV